MIGTQLQGNGMVSISKKTLEKSLEYLVCPKERAQLKLDIGRREDIDEGSFICTKCDESYEIENGVSHFVKSPQQ